MADTTISILNGALQELPDGSIVLRGVIGPHGLQKLKFPSYQKKTHSHSKLRRLAQAVMAGSRLPDIEVGLRGSEKFTCSGDTYILTDPCYVIDGEQRRTALLAVASRHPQTECSIGVVVNFNTTEKWERERFAALATDRTPVAPSVLLRNAGKDHRVASMIHALTTDHPESVLYRRITWDQFQMQGELVRASTLYRIICILHSWVVAPRSTRVSHMLANVDEIAVTIGAEVMLQNARTFFELVDHYWGFRNVQKRDDGAQLRTVFLLAMAELMAKLKVFWNGHALDDGATVRRLKGKLEITGKVRELISPHTDARNILVSYYQASLNRSRAEPFQERSLATRHRDRTPEDKAEAA